MITVLTSTTRSSLSNVILGSGYSLAVPNSIGWGTGTANASATNVGLSYPAGAPVSGTVSRVSNNTANDTFLCSAVLTASGTLPVSEIGLFTNTSNPPVGFLVNPISFSSNKIVLSNYNLFPNSYPFNIQVLSEVMTVTSGDGSTTFNVIRGANGSNITTTTIPALTPVVGPAGYMFMKSSFPSIGLQAGDSIQFNVSIQFI